MIILVKGEVFLRIAALILGILGGLIGLGWAIITLAVKISEINSFTDTECKILLLCGYA